MDSQLPFLVATQEAWPSFLAFTPRAHQHCHPQLTAQPCTPHPAHVAALGTGLQFFKTSQFPTEVACWNCRKTVRASLASLTRSARRDTGNGQETLHFTAALPLHSMPHLSSTPIPDLALVQPFLHKHWRLIWGQVQIKSQIYHLIYYYFLWRRLAPCFTLNCTCIWKKMHIFNCWFSKIHRKLKTSSYLVLSDLIFLELCADTRGDDAQKRCTMGKPASQVSAFLFLCFTVILVLLPLKKTKAEIRTNSFTLLLCTVTGTADGK